MPSNSADFLYSLLTMTIVSVTLTFSVASYMNVLRQTSEVNQLSQILDQAAAKATGALDIVTENNATISVVIQLPLRIGDRDYWIRFANDSSKAWVEGAFGSLSRSEEQEHRVYLPSKVQAHGTFEGGYEFAMLSCSLNGSIPQLTLSRRE